MLESLATAMATSATGYAAIINGVMDIRTVSDCERGAAINAIWVCSGGTMTVACNDPDCGCAARLLKLHWPDTKLVRVSVQVAQ